MRYFFDTEFEEIGNVLHLISIGVVSEDGREFYAVTDYDPQGAWLKANVNPRLQPKDSPPFFAQVSSTIRGDLARWVGDDPKPVFWAYYGSYDWVALCQLMGGMMNLPRGWYWIVQDLRTELDRAGFKDVRDDGRDDEHNALADARWIRDAWSKHLAAPRSPKSEAK